MPLLTAEHISKSFDERVLFRDISFGIEAGERVGLIGINGGGKTTLLRIIAGAEEPDEGQIARRQGLRVTYLSQTPEMDETQTVREYMWSGAGSAHLLLRDYEAAAARLREAPHDGAAAAQLAELQTQLDSANAWDSEAQVAAMLDRFGIPDADQITGTLSGGQRRRLALARALIEPADLLILDEPTNHLDVDTVAWLEATLLRMSAAVLLVTHDRYVLDRLVQRTLELDDGKLYQYTGGYSAFLQGRLQREQSAAADRERYNSVLRNELAWLRQGPQGRGSKQQARINRIEAMRENAPEAIRRELSITLGTQRLGTRVFELAHVDKRFGDRTLLHDLTLRIEPGERLGIVGPNGVGKSTLLNMLAGRITPDNGSIITGETVRLAYYDQEAVALDDSQRLIDYVSEAAPLIQTSDGDVVSAAEMLERFLFAPRMHYNVIGKLSGGERRRLYLLRTLMFAPNVLLLDEPSNDLDVQTLATLEAYLDTFPGTLIIASHDRYLLDRTVDHLLVFGGAGQARTFPGAYSAYAAAQAASANAAPQASPKAASKPAAQPAASKSERPRKLSFKEQRELEALEQQIAHLEAEQTDLNARISTGALDYTTMQQLAQRLAAIEPELEQAFERWADLAARAEG